MQEDPKKNKKLRRDREGKIVTQDASTKQLKFVEMMSIGMTQSEAARQAGYAEPVREGYRLMCLPHISSAIKLQRDKQLQGDIGSLALKRIKILLSDDETPQQVAFQAAKWVLEQNGHGFVNRSKDNILLSDKNLNEMTLAELDAFIESGKKVAERLAFIDVETSDKPL